MVVEVHAFFIVRILRYPDRSSLSSLRTTLYDFVLLHASCSLPDIRLYFTPDRRLHLYFDVVSCLSVRAAPLAFDLVIFS